METITKSHSAHSLARDYCAVRARTMEICESLAVDDHGVQTMEQVSPPKWHLAHVTWYFETFVLSKADAAYRPYDERFHAVFNSYYEGVGKPFPRAERGKLSRPTLEEVHEYRAFVDQRMAELFASSALENSEELRFRILLGVQHEEQHQELLLMDIKHILGTNPLRPNYGGQMPARSRIAGELRMIEFEGGRKEIGHSGAGFCFDNERPRHTVWLETFRLAQRLVRNQEFAEFIDDGGYRRPELWLADGWAAVQEFAWSAPEYWYTKGGEHWEYTLEGAKQLQPEASVLHVSYYEADAYARWAGRRLPTEAEWEVAAGVPDSGLEQLFGEAWQWTSSAYSPYPRFRTFRGELGEYNGKFMCNQLVLRGSCFATPPNHARATYRNFFYPAERWAFGSIRLAEDVGA